MYSTAVEYRMRKQAEEGAGMDPTGGDSPMRKQAEDGALTGVESSMEKKTRIDPYTKAPIVGTRMEALAMISASRRMKKLRAGMKAASGLELGGKHKRTRSKSTQNAEGGKAAASAWRPEESVKETGRPEEAFAEAAKAYSDTEIEKRSEMAYARALMREELVFGIPDFPSSNFPQMTPKQQVKITSERSKEQSEGVSEADNRAQRQYELLCAEEEPLPVEVDIGGDSRTMPPMPDSSTVITSQLQDNLRQREAEREQKQAPKAKKPDSKKTKEKMKKSRKHAEDSIGSYKLGERSYEGVTLKEATRLHQKHLELLAKKNKKNQKKVKDEEDAGKAVASVTDAGRPEESAADARKPEESMTEAWKAEEALTAGSSKEVVSLETEQYVPEATEKKAMEAEKELTFPVLDFYSRMTPEEPEKQLKYMRARAVIDKMVYNHGKPLESQWSENSAGGIQEEAENGLGKILEMMRISPERNLYDEIQRTLLDVQYDLTSKNRKLDKETLQVLKDMSNKLTMLDQGGDEDKKDEEDLHHDPRAKKTVEEEMADEAETFNSHRRLWKYKHGRTCGSFEDITVLSSMQFTHYTPGRGSYSSDCTTPETLQIISMKLTEVAGGLELPFSVYGVVAVRDMVDRNRNILFYLDRSNAQELKQNDPFLHLIGPSRAIVFTDKVWIEIELIVKGCPQDKDLISCARCYTGGYGPGMSTICFKNALCTLELCLEPVKKTTQATILGVHVVKDSGSWPFKYGGIVACSPQPGEYVWNDSGLTRRISPSSSEIVLIHSKDEAMPKGENGHVLLSRQVVSVNLKGMLDVVIKAYSKAGDIAAETRVPFYPKVCNISKKKCLLGDAEVAITVAWSLVATSKTGLWIELANRRCVSSMQAAAR